MLIYLKFLTIGFSIAQDHETQDYVDVGRYSDLEEISYTSDNSSSNQILQLHIHNRTYDLIEISSEAIDKQIIEETNEKMRQLAQTLEDLAEIQEMLGEKVLEQGEDLTTAEKAVETADTQIIATNVILEEAEKLQHSNFFLSLFLKDGIPLSTGAGIGTAGFFATKAVVLTAAPALATTAAPIAIPAVLAIAAGGGAWALSKLVMKTVV